VNVNSVTDTCASHSFTRISRGNGGRISSFTSSVKDARALAFDTVAVASPIALFPNLSVTPHAKTHSNRTSDTDARSSSSIAFPPPLLPVAVVSLDIDPTVASSHVIALKSTSIPAYGTRNDCAGTSNLNLASHEDSDAKLSSSIVHRATPALDPDADAATKRHARRATNETTRGTFDSRTVLVRATRRPDRRADARLEREMAPSTDIASVRARCARRTDAAVAQSALIHSFMRFAPFALSFATSDARFVGAVQMR
jgi:hypothetical protein